MKAGHLTRLRHLEEQAHDEGEPEWTRTVGLCALLQAARGHVVPLHIVYDSHDGEPPEEGDTVWYARPDQPYTDSLTRLLAEARRYDAARRREQPDAGDPP